MPRRLRLHLLIALSCLCATFSARSSLGDVHAARPALASMTREHTARPVRASASEVHAARPAPESTLYSTRYIVQLADPPLLSYRGGISGYAATSPSVVGSAMDRFDVSSPAVIAYSAYLDSRQAEFEADLDRIAPVAEPQYHYKTALNALTVRLKPEEAAAVRRLPGVRAVTAEERIVPLMDASIGQIHAPEAWDDARLGGAANAGKDIRIAVIDTGIVARHPFFDDEGFELPESGDFPIATWTVGDDETAFSAAETAQFTNNKVIVARAYANPEVYDPAQPPLPVGGQFHGSHVAGTAAGIVTTGSPGGAVTGVLPISGVAPGAYLMSYRFDEAYTPEIIRMIEDAVRDGADVINNSWGTSAMNLISHEGHPVAEAFKAATDAGVVVVAAAGNSGANGEATLGGPHQISADTITVANVQTGRSFSYFLEASDTELPDELQRHPTVYAGFGRLWDGVEHPVFQNELCDPLGVLAGARGRVVLTPMAGACPNELIGLGEPYQWIDKLVYAGLANMAGEVVEAVVFYSDDGDLATPATGLFLVEFLTPFLEASFPGIKLPITAVISGDEAMALVDWSNEHPTLELHLLNRPETAITASLVDAANSTTSQGPTPDGRVKPDLSAPGTDILSAYTDSSGAPYGYSTASGTSMASPHVAGAAAVVRHAWPDWTPAEIKSALMVTADPVVTTGGSVAPATVQGTGRLNLARAIDPGLLAQPPSLSWHVADNEAVPPPARVNLRDVRGSATAGATYTLVEEPGTGGITETHILDIAAGQTVTVPIGGEVNIDIGLDPDALPDTPGAYDGRLALVGEDHTIRVLYRLTVPGDRKDVLLLNVPVSYEANEPEGQQDFRSKTDYAEYWTSALDEAELTYDVWTVAPEQHDSAPPLAVLQDYDLVVLAAGDGNAPLHLMANGMTSLQMYLLGGGSMLVSGSRYVHGPTFETMFVMQGSGSMHFLSRYFSGFDLTDDDAPQSELLPLRVFDKPITLSTTSTADAAGNGATLDLGRPLTQLQTLVEGDQFAPDMGIAAPMVVDRVMPYMRSYVETAAGRSAVTGVTADATLEHPVRSQHIPWRAMFAGFGLEAVATEQGRHSRWELLSRVHAWSVEPEDVVVTIEGTGSADAGETLTFAATATSGSGVPIVGWRWDPGDGSAYVEAEDSLDLVYPDKGVFVLRAEAMTAAGHTYVGEHVVRISGPTAVYLPFSANRYALP